MFGGDGLDLPLALGMEAFVSIHMSVFVLSPLSSIIADRFMKDKKKVFWSMFFIRVAILLIFDFFITTGIALIDFFAVFIGAFTLVPLSIFFNLRKDKLSFSSKDTLPAKPGTPIQASTPKNAVTPSDFDPAFALSEEECLETFIQRELQRTGIYETKGLIPQEVLRRKTILHIIFAILLYGYISSIFFHFPLPVYFFGLGILIVYGILTNRYKLMTYLKKELKSRPQEKISNVVMMVKSSLVPDYSNKLQLAVVTIAIIGALLTFLQPRIFYEKAENGYHVRFYAFGVTNMTSATIPDTYQGEPVVGLRGNTFSNMFFLKEVNLPDSVTEIRGQAFKNCFSLSTLKLPRRLVYLGGGAFYNCTSLEEISLPDTITYLGGEAFYRCTSLKTVHLPSSLPEIRGNTFEGCRALLQIEIPDTVTRIGGHAFYGNTTLGSVMISPDSNLQEIGSSAFRKCYALKEITLPQNISISDRAFKETNVRINYYE